MSFGWGEDSGRQNGPSWSDRIASNIQKINASTADVKRQVEVLGTSQDSAQLREKVRNTIEATQQLIKATNEQFRIQKQSLTSASDNEQLRRLAGQYSSGCSAFEDAATKVARRQREVVVEMSVPNSGYMGGDSTGQPRGMALQAQEFSAVDVDLIKERNVEIEHLEQDLVGLHELTIDMATLVNEQQEGLEVIEEHVTTAGVAVREGVEELKGANKYQKKSRKKMCIITLLIIVVAAIIIVSSVCGSGKC